MADATGEEVQVPGTPSHMANCIVFRQSLMLAEAPEGLMSPNQHKSSGGVCACVCIFVCVNSYVCVHLRMCICLYVLRPKQEQPARLRGLLKAPAA